MKWKMNMDWTNKMIETGDGALLYTRHIGQGQPLLLIHGAVVDSEFFADFAEILSEKYHVITYDRRGYGYSGTDGKEKDQELYPGVTDGQEYYRRQAKDACLVLKEYSKEPAVVLGCSAGAFVAMALAAEHPEMIRQLFLHEPPAYILMKEDAQVWEIIDEITENIRGQRYNRALNRFLLFVTDPRESKREMNQHEVHFFMKNGLNFIKNEFLLTFSSDILPKKLPEGMDALVLCGQETGDAPHGIAAKRVADRFGLKLAYMPGFHNAVREESRVFAQKLYPLLTMER